MSAQLHTVVVDCFVVKEVHLLEDVDQVDLVIRLQVLLYDPRELFVEGLDHRCLILFGLYLLTSELRWTIHCLGGEESVSRVSLLVLVEAGVAVVRNNTVCVFGHLGTEEAVV